VGWLDNVIGWISPEAGLRRERMRQALEMARSYEGARHGRRTAGWSSGSGSANAEIGPSLTTLRNRSRQLIRDNSYAARAIEAHVSSAIGTGIVGKYAERLPSGLYAKWCEQCDADGGLDFYGLQALAARGEYESGEVFIQRIFPESNRGLEIPLQLRVLESDFLDSTKTERLSNGNFVITGVEHDASGQRVAYWFFDSHPGEVIALTGFGLKSRRVPADQVIHLYVRKRPQQVRGVPRLAAAMMRLRDLDEYEEAELVRKKIESCFAAFVTTSDDRQTLANQVTTTPSGPRIETVSPGMINYLRPGESVEFGAPSGADNSQYVMNQLYAIAAGAGVTFEQLTGNYSRATFSSVRAGVVEYRQMVEAYRWLTFIPLVCRRVAMWFNEAAMRAGRTRTLDYVPKWTPPTWAWVDPLKDVQAKKEEISGGLITWSEAVRERGYDPDEMRQEMKTEREQLAEDGITLDTTSKASAGASAPADPDDSATADGGDDAGAPAADS